MYWTFFGLREDPFRLTPDPRFLHLAEPHRNALIALLQGILYRKGLLLLVGPIGTGKTTLLHTMLGVLAQKYTGERRIASAFIVNPTLTRQEFLENLLVEFEIDCTVNTKPRQLLALHESLLAVQRRNSTAVLIIDEAHLLTSELLDEIRLLSNLDTYRDKPLQIVLCGQPELITILDSPRMAALRQRISVRTQLRALSLPETRAYIAERLHAAGLRGPSPFPSAALEEIFRCSGGVPRVTNMICDACLEASYAAQRKQIGVDTVHDMAASLIAVDAPLQVSPAQPHDAPQHRGTPRIAGEILGLWSNTVRSKS